ncbi:MAG: SIS domain-containing protein [Clostridia bacterium]|nr:SIS domain-containing protein [Clostridia bacterium]
MDNIEVTNEKEEKVVENQQEEKAKVVNKKIVGIGNFTIDANYKNDVLFQYNCGQTVFNVLYNLKNNYPCDVFAYGNVGRDKIGKIALEKTEQEGINIDYLKRKSRRTRIVHQNNYVFNGKKILEDTTTRCIYCGKNTFKPFTKNISLRKGVFKKENFDIAVFDSPTISNLKIAKYLKEKQNIVSFLDFGYHTFLNKKSAEYLRNYLKNFNFDFVQLNSRVADFFMQRLKLKSNFTLFKILNCKFMSITRGKEGTDIFWKNANNNLCNVEHIDLNISKVVNSYGAGDAFLTGIIITYLKKGENFKEYNVALKENCQKLVANVLSDFPARYKEEGFDFSFNTKNCSCCGNKLKEKTKLQRSLYMLLDRVQNAYEVGFDKNLKKFLDTSEKILLVGTGASFITGSYLKDMFEKYGKICNCVKPTDVKDVNLDIYDSVVFCSYSGTSPDIRKCIESIQNKKINIVLLTGNDVSNLTIYPKNVKIISYANSRLEKERGYISVASIIVPAFFATKICLNIEDMEEFLVQSVINFRHYDEKIDVVKEEPNLVDIFYNGYTTTIAQDLECKMVESSFGRVLLSNKKDFSHGRYTTFGNYKSDLVIYYDYNKDDKYEELLMSLIKKYGNHNVFVINPITKREELKEFELLLFNMYFINYLDKLITIDVSSPKHNKAFNSLYKFD